MSTYLIQSTLCLAILFKVYHLFLEGERMHHFKRYYLLFALFFSQVIPLIHLPAKWTWWAGFNEIGPLTWEISSIAGKSTLASPNGDLEVLGYFYLLGVIIFGTRFLVRVHSMYQKIRRSPKVHFKDYSLILTSAETLPQTFGKFIFLNAGDYANGKIEPELMAHELAHVRERHSADVMILELLKIILWFQPLIYLYQRAIRLNHEFLADAAVLRRRRDVIQYQHLLLDKVAVSSKIDLASNLNFLLTKKRLNMMTKNTSTRRALLLGSLSLPLFVVLLMAFARPSLAQTTPETVPSDMQSLSLQELKDVYFKDASFILIQDGKKTAKAYHELTDAEREAIPMPPPPPPAPPAPKVAGATPAVAPTPPPAPKHEPLTKGTIVEVDFNKNRLWIKGDGMSEPPPPPPAPVPPPPPIKEN